MAVRKNQNHLIVLGDLGTGKTTLTRFLAYQLGLAFLEDPIRHPAPVFIPLREARRAAFDLETIILSHFNRNGLSDVKFSNFEHLLRSRKIVLFFDAFDEMADRIRWEETRANFAELKRAVSQSSKVILTCRTHYFKNREEQIEILGEGPSYTEAVTELYREIAGSPGHDVVNLSEFTDEQIQEYLRRARPETHQEDWRKIQDIYDLAGLAHRPLLLDMIVKSLPKLKAGEDISASDLYTVYTDIWVQREEPKHPLLKPKVKLELMLELAWRMWLAEQSEIKLEDMARFVEELLKKGAIDIQDEEARDIVREMHAATFLKRGKGDAFTFVHRSFMEYFLARKICQASGVIDKRGKSLERIQAETANPFQTLTSRRIEQKIVFFIAGLDKFDLFVDPLQKFLRTPFQERLSENALQVLYWTGRVRMGAEKKISNSQSLSKALKRRLPNSARLVGANLEEMVLECSSLAKADLREANLTSANLNSAFLLGADLTGADLSNASCIRADISAANLRKANLRSANFDGGILRDTILHDANFENATFVKANTRGAVGLPPESMASAKPRPAHDFHAVAQVGHTRPVQGLAFHPTADVIASSADDDCIKIWRQSNGRLLRTLKGHSGSVFALAFSPDGQTLASGSSDESIKLWQPQNGKELRTLKGHSGYVLALAFSPDGQTLASGSYDESIKLWQPQNGKELRTLKGHSGSVDALAFSPDGQTLASGSSDGSLIIWSVQAGRKICTLYGIAEGVWLMVLPGGRFHASPQGMPYLSYTSTESFESYTAEEWAQELYKPEEVLAELRKAFK